MTKIRPIRAPLSQTSQGAEVAVANLQDALLLLLHRQILQVSDRDRQFYEEELLREQREKIYSGSTLRLVALFQKQHQLNPGDNQGNVDESTALALNKVLKELGAFDQELPKTDEARSVVKGEVRSLNRAGVNGLRVEIVDKNVGTDVQIVSTTTDERGSYQTRYSLTDIQRRGKQTPDLQSRVFVGEVFLGASEVRYNASDNETLNVLLPETADATLASEHQTLLNNLSAHFQGNLRDLQETDDRQDITYLANKTGWDARAVAIAALADQFSHRAEKAEIPTSFFYALFRAGLPANEDTLYRADAGTLAAIWKKAAEQGVIEQELTGTIPQVVERFQALSAQKLLTDPALVGTSSLKEMLTTSRLDNQEQAMFAQIYAENSADLPTFWKAVGDAFGADKAKRLQVDGKLGFLTINNAPLMQKVHSTVGANGLSDPLQLAQTGYHHAEQWSQLLTEDVPIPKEIPGDTPETKRANYTNYLAAQVRLSYPTASVAQMVKSGALPLTGAANGVSDQVHAFLTEHQGNFEIGVQPVQQYIAQKDLQIADETVQQVKRLQRVYQITSSDQALIGLMKRGIDAAYHVVCYDKDTFVQSFAADLGGANQAELTYDRSVQIHNVVLNIALSYLNARTAPAIGVHSPPNVLDPAPAHTGDVIAYATLESLFGSMDFCACDHCRSILSPAAYLVDLLLFLDQPNPPSGTKNPQTVLLDRRPDIQHLPLTCENTNTALPYIDVVNETLEYFIANSTQKLSLNDYHGHDTNGVASEDLLASPQFVMDSAYTTLRNESFPAPLPFHQPLENLRRYFDRFEVPLPLAMEQLRKTDDLDRGANPYGWRDILMEEIGLSRTEYEILTDSTAVPLWRMYGFPNGTLDVDVIAGLSNAKQFARRVGITYEELVSILKTRFINPNSDLIPKLERLGVNLAMLAELKTKNDAPTDTKFDTLLAALAVPPAPSEYGGDIKAWVKNDENSTRIMDLITLTIPIATWAASKVCTIGDCVRPSSPQTGSTLYYECTKPGTSAASEPTWPTTPGGTCNDGPIVWTCRDASSCLSFDNLAFRYSDPAKLTQNMGAVEFVRLLRFIRLWKKLGWTMEQTDAALCALYREDLAPLNASDINDITKLNSGFLTLLSRLGIVFRVMKALNLTVKRDILPLLACWSEIDTHGDTALYRLMFLNPLLLKQDAVFADNGYGNFLTDSTKKLADHAEALRSAFNLTGDEYAPIVAALGYDANTPLTISNVSAIYRHGWLARKLKFSVRELLLLIQLTGLDPFAAPDPTNPAILRLISLVQALKDRSVKSTAMLYLLWNQDLSGKSAPDSAQTAAFARTLRLGLAAVETEFAVADDPDGAIAQAQFAKVYGADAAAFFFGLLNDTLTVEVEFSDPDGTLAAGTGRQAIENAAGKTDAGVPKIAYDGFRKRLSYSGILTLATRDAIGLAAGAGATAFKTAVGNLYDKNQAVINPFFSRYTELRPPYNTYASDTVHSASEKRNILLKAILPDLVKRQKRQQALQAVSAVANTNLALTQTFLDPPATPFPLHATGHTDQPALNDLLALETAGLSVQFFASDTATGAIIPSADITLKLDYAPLVGGVGNPLPTNPTPGAAISGIWRGYLEAPESGFFNLRIEADAGATVTLALDNKPVTLSQNENVVPIELRAGTLYSIDLTVEKVRNIVRVQWEWDPKGQGRAVIPARYLYPAVPFGAFKQAYIRFLKAESLATGLGLTANELAYFATNSDYHVNGEGWLNALAVSGNPAPSTALALLNPFEALLEFARLKADISPGDESLLAALKDPSAATQNMESLLFTITRWNQTSLNDMLAQFSGNIAGLGHFDLFRRVYDALALTQKMGISAKALILATTNEPTSHTVHDLQAALRARYEANDWRDVVRQINDEMRSLQRDALVSYILHQMRAHPESAHIDTADKLFEYFLTDVQMDPCMQTSRIRHALSSIQLFIERCLMNLEPRVSPAAINAKQWTWMKRYRVWEANRNVYLLPENWLEPELRDDKSPFFKEIESELLQSDITEDSATTALLNYLSKLEEIAKLEPCGMYHIPAGQRTGEINHVVARTAGANRKYYYRRYEYGYWTPWEQIKLDIEDNPVIPVVWNDRLLLFWLRILKKGPETAQKPPMDKDLIALKMKDLPDDPNVNVQAVLCWSEYYNGKWQATKTSDVNNPAKLGSFDVAGFDRSILGLSVLENDDNLAIAIDGGHHKASFMLYNTHSLPVPTEYPSVFGKQSIGYGTGKRRSLVTNSNTLAAYYFNKKIQGIPPSNPMIRNVLTDSIVCDTIAPYHFLDKPWDAPFFFVDSRHVFFVTTEETPVWIRDDLPYGIAVTPDFNQSAQIPPLILQTVPGFQIGPKFWGDGGPVVPDLNIINPAPMQRYVTEDAYIRQGIGTTGSVIYGDRQIGPSGTLSNNRAET